MGLAQASRPLPQSCSSPSSPSTEHLPYRGHSHKPYTVPATRGPHSTLQAHSAAPRFPNIFSPCPGPSLHLTHQPPDTSHPKSPLPGGLPVPHPSAASSAKWGQSLPPGGHWRGKSVCRMGRTQNTGHEHHCPRGSVRTYLILTRSPGEGGREVLPFSPLYRQGGQSAERSSGRPEVTQLVQGIQSWDSNPGLSGSKVH